MRSTYIIGGFALLIVAAIGLSLWWTVICCIIGIVCGVIGFLMLIYGLISDRPRPVVLGKQRVICPHCYRGVDNFNGSWYCSHCRRWL